MFIFTKYPMPPSSNQMYASVRGRLIKSAEAKRYAQSVQLYAKEYADKVEDFKKQYSPDSLLHVECYFVFEKARVIGQKGQHKKIDASNRVKACHDQLSEMIGIDDKQFISSYCEKLVTDESEPEQVIIVIKQAPQRSLQELILTI